MFGVDSMGFYEKKMVGFEGEAAAGTPQYRGLGIGLDQFGIRVAVTFIEGIGTKAAFSRSRSRGRG